MRPYPRYRDSGVEWLGEVPEHWEVRRLVRSVSRSDVKVEADDADGLPYVGLEHIASWTGSLLPLDEQQSPESISNAFMSNDVLFGKLRPYLAKAFIAEFEGLCSTEFLVLRPFAYDRRYLLYGMLTDGFVSLVDSSTYGAKMPRANWDFVGSTPFPLPPLAEQRAIAAYLDRETERIDALVAKQRLLIERVGEYRTALITRTVTRGLPPEAAGAAGLDPAARLKPSGIEWLGDVPEHWEVKCISAAARPGPDSFTDGDWVELPYITDSGVRLIQTGTVGIGAYREQGFRYIDDSSFDELRCTAIEPGDVLICRLADPVGRACLAPDLGVRMITSVDVCILKPSGQFSAKYLVFFLSSKQYLDHIDSLVRGGTRDRISRSMLGAIKIPSPPVTEQRAIAAFLHGETTRIDGLTREVETAIERLQEYRTALITAAVTGKIDVREPATVLGDPPESRP